MAVHGADGLLGPFEFHSMKCPVTSGQRSPKVRNGLKETELHVVIEMLYVYL